MSKRHKMCSLRRKAHPNISPLPKTHVLYDISTPLGLYCFCFTMPHSQSIILSNFVIADTRHSVLTFCMQLCVIGFILAHSQADVPTQCFWGLGVHILCVQCGCWVSHQINSWQLKWHVTASESDVRDVHCSDWYSDILTTIRINIYYTSWRSSVCIQFELTIT